MADVMGGGGSSSISNGNGIHATRRPTAAPAPTSSPSGIRGPRAIMTERLAREARQKAEAERSEQSRIEQERINRAEHEARVSEEARRRVQERQAAGVATAQPGADATSYPDPNQQGQQAPQTPRGPRATTTQHQQPQQQTPQLTSRFAPSQQAPPQFTAPSGTQRQAQPPQPDPSAQPLSASKPRNSFPHAFERWETLSAHWEGLTSYWIRKLEQNKDEVNRDPVSQQLARQVTDLSAAGANLFHAVVELQRLRASSERKFQRWFFETRGELERAQEVNGILEATLEKERRERAEAIRHAVDQEKGSSKAQKQLAEMRKELAISKEEARRAWEELGRREQEERDRTYSLQASLQNGQPTFVGGVQVVPMTTQGASSRYTEPVYAPDPPPAIPNHPHPSAATPSGGSSSGTPAGYYRPQDASSQQQQQQQRPSAVPAAPVSEGGFSEGEYVIDAQGNFVLDSQGNRIAFAAPPSTVSVSDADPEEYETPATTNPPSGGYDAPTTSAPPSQWTAAQPEPQDYSGQGYAAPGWETVPRHHHPTRLSDVIEEEDEKSRTSASQVSRH